MEPHGVERGDRVRVAAGTAPGTSVRKATMLEDVSRPRGATPSLSEVIAAMAERRPGLGDERPGVEVERVSCPGCNTEYGLPPGLTPPWGGRVRCPRCATEFSVGVRAVADELVARVAGMDPEGWARACADRSLWAAWGAELMETYGALRERFGAQVAARAFRRALEDAAPGVPWFAPPTPPNPLEHEAVGAGGTMFERRQGS
jgi:predicted Zn finger-like uncharacterized protein